MFDSIYTLLSSINIFGIGISLAIVMLIFMISRGITKDNEDIFKYFIMFGLVFMFTLFAGDYAKVFLYFIVLIVVILYGLRYLHIKREKRDSG